MVWILSPYPFYLTGQFPSASLPQYKSPPMRSFVTSSDRHVTPIAATGPGRREGPSPYTKLHRVGGPDVAKVRSLTKLCGLRQKETYNATKGPLKCERYQGIWHTQCNCVYAPWCVACGHAHSQGRVSPKKSS
jgi:hypothetical protein